MRKARIAVLVSGGGTNLQALLDAQKSGILQSGEISLVIANNPKAYALKRAERAGVRHLVLTGAEFEARLEEVLRESNIDLIILAGFMRILSAGFTSFCGKGFYGLRVHEAALERGVKVTGATVHFVNEIPDGGEIILQKAVEVLPDDTPETLQRRVMEEAEWILLPQAAERVSKGVIQA